MASPFLMTLASFKPHRTSWLCGEKPDYYWLLKPDYLHLLCFWVTCYTIIYLLNSIASMNRWGHNERF